MLAYLGMIALGATGFVASYKIYNKKKAFSDLDDGFYCKINE